MRKVWSVAWTTHGNLLPHVAGDMDLELCCFKRCIKFIKMVLKGKCGTN